MKTALLYELIAKLGSHDETERLRAVYDLWPDDKRARIHLIRPLLDRSQPPAVRGQAAENLKNSRSRKVMKALAECSRDPSPEVRFWCVFALGHFIRCRKTPLIVVRALEERLQDAECPNGWWPIGLEALAMLRGCTNTRFPVEAEFRKKMFETMRDPLSHPTHWRWTECYKDGREVWAAELEPLYDDALRKVREAGYSS